MLSHWFVTVFMNQPAALSQPVQTAKAASHSRQCARVQATTLPVAALGPKPGGKEGELEACWQVLPFRNQPFVVSHPVQVWWLALHLTQ